MSFWEKIIGKGVEKKGQDIQAEILRVKEELARLEGLAGKEAEVQGLKDKLVLLEEMRRRQEEKRLEGLSG